jgi:DNA-binding transcriptional regulator YdaS (Cro superfamily)
MTPLEEAVKKIGGCEAVAALFGITRQAVSQWTKVPADRVLIISKKSGVSCYRLRPDLYPKKY